MLDMAFDLVDVGTPPFTHHLGRAMYRIYQRSAVYDLWLRCQQPLKLTQAVPNPFPADPGNGRRLLSGRIRFGSAVVDSPLTPDIFSFSDSIPSWKAALHSFCWIPDLEAADSEPARQTARMMTEAWLRAYDRWDAIAWRPDVTAVRLMIWSIHADFLLESTDRQTRQHVLAHMGRQFRYLQSSVSTVPDGPARILIYTSVLLISLMSGNPARHKAERGLVQSITSQILPDGCHISRRPDAGLQCLITLIYARAAYASVQEAFPAPLLAAIERCAPMVRFFQMGDKALAPFHGGGTRTAHLVTTVLGVSKARGKPPETAAHGGYYRLTARNVTVLMDAGSPPNHGIGAIPQASTGALHICVGKHRLISSCSFASALGTEMDQVLSCTAAHSAFEVVGYDSANVHKKKTYREHDLTVTHRAWISETDYDMAVVDHDGYKKHGYHAQRSVALNRKGTDIHGWEVIKGTPNAGHQVFAVRFHLHPSVRVSLVENGRAALLRIGSAGGWRLRVGPSHVLSVQESIHLAADLVRRRASQLVISGLLGPGEARIEWLLQAFDRKS